MTSSRQTEDISDKPSMETMDPINPWIDLAETRRMAERLKLPARVPIAMPDETGFDDSFEGFSPESEGADATVASSDASAPVEETPETPEKAGPSQAAVEVTPELAAHMAWLGERFDARGFFIVDADGVLVHSVGGYDGLHFVAREWIAAATPHSVRLRIRSNAVLEVISLKGDAGNRCICVVVPAPLSQDAVSEIRHHWLVG